MRVARFVPSLFLTLLSVHPLRAQQPPSPPQRDAQALSVLTQMNAATGWSSAAVPEDTIATGSITRYGPASPDSASVTLTSKGPRLYRSDVQDSTGLTTTVVNGDGAGIFAPSGPRVLPFHTALGMRPMVFPFYGGLLIFTNITSSLQYLGTETVAGQPAYRVAISQQPAGPDSASALRALTNRLTVWVSTTSGLPIQVEYVRLSIDNPTAFRPITRTFSDYRMVNGLAVPFHQEESANGQLLSSLQLNSVTFNSGIADSQFALPAAQN